MTAAWRYPAAVPQNFYGATVTHMICVLLGTGITSIPGSAKVLSDVSSLEIGSTAGYLASGGFWSATAACQMPDLQTVYDDTAGISEIGYSATNWASSTSVTATFRWVVIASGNTIISVLDMGSAQAIVAQPLILTIPVSPSIPTNYPIQRFRRTT